MTTRGDTPALSLAAPRESAAPLFHALPADAANAPATAVPLYEFVHRGGTQRAYSTDAAWSQPDFRRGEKHLCRVWSAPSRAAIPAD